MYLPKLAASHSGLENVKGMSTTAATAPPGPAMDGLPPERRRWAVAAIFTALAMATLDTAIANIALPTIAADLHVSPADVVWVVNVYQIALVTTLLPLGALGEIVGHQRIYLCGLLLFTRSHPLPLVAYRSATDVPAAFLSGPRLGITLIRLRDGPKEHRVVAPQGTGILSVRVMPDSLSGPSGYAIKVAFDASMIARAVTVDNLKADRDGFVEIYLPVADVVGHTLKVTVTPAPSQGTTPLSFRLQVASSSNTSDETR